VKIFRSPVKSWKSRKVIRGPGIPGVKCRDCTSASSVRSGCNPASVKRYTTRIARGEDEPLGFTHRSIQLVRVGRIVPILAEDDVIEATQIAGPSAVLPMSKRAYFTPAAARL